VPDFALEHGEHTHVPSSSVLDSQLFLVLAAPSGGPKSEIVFAKFSKTHFNSGGQMLPAKILREFVNS